MKAIACQDAAEGNAGPFVAIDMPQPSPGPRDLLVKVHAVSVNPVDIAADRIANESVFKGLLADVHIELQ